MHCCVTASDNKAWQVYIRPCTGRACQSAICSRPVKMAKSEVMERKHNLEVYLICIYDTEPFYRGPQFFDCANKNMQDL
jgi:hypothetical protein